MKKVVLTLLCFTLVMGCLIWAGPRVSAAEPDLDWDDPKAWRDRLMEADLDIVFATLEYADGAMGQILSYIMQNRFAENPFGFAEALSRESNDIQHLAFMLFGYDAEYFPYLLTIANLIDPEEMENPQAREIMIRLQNEIRAAFNSGDPTFDAETDWDTVDWDTYDWSRLTENDFAEWNSLENWLRNEASLEDLLYLDGHCSHAAFSESISTIVIERFLAQPEEMLRAIAAHEGWEHFHVTSIAFGANKEQRTELIALLESMVLDPAEDPSVGAVLSDLVATVEEMYHVQISNPGTGDSIGIFAGLMAASGLAAAALVRRRRKAA